MQSRSIQADILNILSDNKVHTLNEIAEEIDVCKLTVYRHIQTLSLNYNIESFHGGDKKGGVRLVKKEVSLDGLSNDDLQQIIATLQSLQDCSTAVKVFTKRLSNHLEK